MSDLIEWILAFLFGLDLVFCVALGFVCGHLHFIAMKIRDISSVIITREKEVNDEQEETSG